MKDTPKKIARPTQKRRGNQSKKNKLPDTWHAGQRGPKRPNSGSTQVGIQNRTSGCASLDHPMCARNARFSGARLYGSRPANNRCNRNGKCKIASAPVFIPAVVTCQPWLNFPGKRSEGKLLSQPRRWQSRLQRVDTRRHQPWFLYSISGVHYDAR